MRRSIYNIIILLLSLLVNFCALDRKIPTSESVPGPLQDPDPNPGSIVHTWCRSPEESEVRYSFVVRSYLNDPSLKTQLTIEKTQTSPEITYILPTNISEQNGIRTYSAPDAMAQIDLSEKPVFHKYRGIVSIGAGENAEVFEVLCRVPGTK